MALPVQRGATVELRHVTKRYAASERGPGAVNDLSLTVKSGEICVLVGPSGCGKTTTLKMVNRLVEPTDGQVLVDGQDVSTVEPTALRRRIGYVIQQTGLFPHRTIADNVATVPRLLGWSSGRIRKRVDELLRLIGLDPERVRRRYPAQLSGGERQRVGVARALAAEPPLLLMDEPFGAVDPIVRGRLQDEMLQLQRQLGMTVLFVTHDIDEAIKLGDRVAVMQQGGVLAQYASPAELLAAPASDFVARFVGEDRGLKRLALMTVTDIAPAHPPIARLGEPCRAAVARAGGARWVLVLDEGGRPEGWLDAEQPSDDGPITPERAAATSPLFSTSTTLHDALSRLLSSAAQMGVIVDERQVYLGAVTLEAIGAALRSSVDVARARRERQEGHTDEATAEAAR
ncbi:MAG: ATP-binding cassette domain-containing protein [Chloroflexi bacterium]|nr:ATP-binding cassette domain-containing protein [Chloroflexota bacterium]